MDQDQIILTARTVDGANAVTTAMAERGLSLAELSDLTAITKPTLHRLRTDGGIRLPWAFRIARIFGCPPSELFQFRDGRPL